MYTHYVPLDEVAFVGEPQFIVALTRSNPRLVLVVNRRDGKLNQAFTFDNNPSQAAPINALIPYPKKPGFFASGTITNVTLTMIDYQYEERLSIL